MDQGSAPPGGEEGQREHYAPPATQESQGDYFIQV